jgi:tRNA pseudouridine38-40 synthase
MQRYKFEIAYNGQPYFGWQRQPNQISVQEVLEVSISKLFHQKVYPITGCGRTDTGVHAHFYIFHIDLPETKWSLEELKYKLNRILPTSISIYSIQKTQENFHARFNAKERTYRYFVHLEKNPFIVEKSLYLSKEVDFDAMNVAASKLIGQKDFTSFSKLHTDAHTNICTVTKAEWIVSNDATAYFEITANRFLRNMVRATVGTLLEVGMGKIQISDIDKILEEKNRGAAKTSVPAHALFLWNVTY